MADLCADWRAKLRISGGYWKIVQFTQPRLLRNFERRDIPLSNPKENIHFTVNKSVFSYPLSFSPSSFENWSITQRAPAHIKNEAFTELVARALACHRTFGSVC